MIADLWSQLVGWLDFVFVQQFDLWVVFGFAAQFMFMLRFVVQWLASERARRSVIPIAFWFFSVGGGSLLFIYAIHIGDPVFIAGQGGGLFIYLRNLWLIFRERRMAAGAG